MVQGYAAGVSVVVGSGGVAVKVTVGGNVSVAVAVGVSDGKSVAVAEALGNSVGEALGDGDGVKVAVRVGKRVAGVGGVAVTKTGVKDGISEVEAAAVWVAGCAHKGVGVGRCGPGRLEMRTSANPVQ
jgi:hypothetical protein